jgi:hypothetical protein
MHRATSRFWDLFNALPKDVQALARKNYDLLKSNPKHPSLHLKKVGTLWSARVGRNHRALASEDEDGLVWVWIGTHKEYDRLLKSRRG